MELFRHMDDASIEALAEEMLLSTYKKGEIIIEFGKIDDSYNIFLI